MANASLRKQFTPPLVGRPLQAAPCFAPFVADAEIVDYYGRLVARAGDYTQER